MDQKDSEARRPTTFAPVVHCAPCHKTANHKKELSPLDEAITRMEEEYLERFPPPEPFKPFPVRLQLEKQETPMDRAISRTLKDFLAKFPEAQIKTEAMKAENLDDFPPSEDKHGAHPLGILHGQRPIKLPTLWQEFSHVVETQEDKERESSDGLEPATEYFKLDISGSPLPGRDSQFGHGNESLNGASGDKSVAASNPYVPFLWPPPDVNRISPPGCNLKFKGRHWRMHKGYMYKMRKHLIVLVEDEQALHIDKRDLANRKM